MPTLPLFCGRFRAASGSALSRSKHSRDNFFVIPAKAGIQQGNIFHWVPLSRE
jgi:hypothetical protein